MVTRRNPGAATSPFGGVAAPGPWCGPAKPPRDPSERGSAVAEFVMVSAVLVLLFVSCLQIGFALYVRNTVQDASSTGARYGALRDRTPEDGVRRTKEILRAQLPEEYSQKVSYRMSEGSAHELAVTVVTPLPVLGPWGVKDRIEVTGHAILPHAGEDN